MKIVKYAFLFLFCFILSQYLLGIYYGRDKKATSDSVVSKKKYSQQTLTRISSPLLIDEGKVKTSLIEGRFEVVNVGDYKLSDLKVSGDCSCTSISFIKKNLDKGGVSEVYYKIDLAKEKAWFNKTIKLEGSFFPETRLIRIEGYRL